MFKFGFTTDTPSLLIFVNLKVVLQIKPNKVFTTKTNLLYDNLSESLSWFVQY